MRSISIAIMVLVFLVPSGISFADVAMKAYLYNPKTDSAVYTYPYPRESQTFRFYPFLVMTATGAPDGAYQLYYVIESGEKTMFQDTLAVEIKKGLLAKEIQLDERHPAADRVRWEHIQRVYEMCDRNVSETARRLSMHRRTLQRILAKRSPK